jgi:hypothetical protein
MPWLSYSSVDPELADKVMYNTLVRVMSPFNKMAQAIVGLFKTYNVSRTGRGPRGDREPVSLKFVATMV